MFSNLLKRSALRASRINITTPLPNADRAGLAICAIMRDEERHIGDWLRFHAAAGVRDFYLYDNLSQDGTVDAARAVPGIRTTILPWKLNTTANQPKLFIPQQIMAYCHAICTFGASHRWMAFIDIDEFLVPCSAAGLPDVLAQLDRFSNISLPWTMFGQCGHYCPPEAAAPFAYQRRASHQEGDLLNFKCIVDPCKVTQVSVHKFQTSDMGETSANDCGIVAHYKERNKKTFLSNKNIQLNHYYSRSRDELEQKICSAVSGIGDKQRESSVRKKVAIIEAQTVSDKTAEEFLRRKQVSNSGELRSYIPT